MKQQEWKALAAECAGTALLVFGGISMVILNFGAGSPISNWLPDALIRRIITGFLFGSVGCLVTLSPLGRLSGAHLNPSVTLAFFGRGLMTWRGMISYIVAQLVGAGVGATALLAWGDMGKSLHEGITLPGQSVMAAFLGETVCTFCLISLILLFTGHDRLKAYTPYMIPFLFALLVGLEAPLSGCSANPARSFGPALITGIWTDHWLYWLAPLTGTCAALLLLMFPFFQWLKTDIAKLYHFSHDATGFLRRHKHPATI
ncbi:aquaporin [Spirosoma sp. SC4-14]|uniref:MIP/aquaporin family protein n=1 Tax=Spirosoma sp. SC4-14 TaxID=3128900 RepID=UPI0030CADCF4